MFRVFKDSTGRYRWFAVTCSAYEDSDREYTTRLGISRTIEHNARLNYLGPLRYWHMKGYDLGDCDFQMQAGPNGNYLFESGTCRGPVSAMLVEKMAREGWQMSPGFVAPYDEPGPPDGAFDDFIILERSTTPPGRSANRFTRLLGQFTKESTNMEKDAEKIARLKELLGGRADLVDALLAEIDNQATALGARAKEDVTVASANMPAEDAAATVADVAASADAAETEETDDETASDNLLSEAEIDAIADKVATRLMEQINAIMAGVSGLDAELKARGYSREKEASNAAEIEGVKTALSELTGIVESMFNRQKEADTALDVLTGDLPSAVFGMAGAMHYRPSQATDSVITEKEKIVVTQQPGDNTVEGWLARSGVV